MTSKSIQELNTYLNTAKERLDTRRTLQIVIGNQASDLDSMASSISYAYLLWEKRASVEETILPVVNIPRNDFKLRTEAVYLFQQVGIDISRLIFLDEIDLRGLHAEERLKLVLIDHNQLDEAQATLANAVDEIIDHHQDASLYPQVTKAKRAIQPVGSTATLIAERIMDQKPRLMDEGLTTLLLGTILLDTVNLSPQRTTSQDKDVVEKLLANSALSQNELFEKIQFEKFNPGTLSTYDLLRKDYKATRIDTIMCGISSVPLSVMQWISRDRCLAEAFSRYAQSHNLDILLTMHFFEDTEFRRELGVFSTKKDLYEKTISCLNNAKMRLDPITLTNQSSSQYGHLSFFRQGNAQISRKKLQPKLNDLFEKSHSIGL